MGQLAAVRVRRYRPRQRSTHRILLQFRHDRTELPPTLGWPQHAHPRLLVGRCSLYVPDGRLQLPYLRPSQYRGWMNYLVSTSNSLTGAQVGGDLWVCIMPGLSIGGEAKAGLYGNRSTQRTTIDAYSIGDPVQEKVTENGAAFLGDANVTLLWRSEPALDVPHRLHVPVDGPSGPGHQQLQSDTSVCR